MKLMNPKHPVKASWIRELAFRLDASPFISGALEARKTLDALNAQKEQLHTLTRGGMDGIYHAGREGRTWVDDRDYGIPFLGSSDILSADLSTLPLISKMQVASKPQFVIRERWTLITRSGTIGRTVYSRGEMDGMACSEHVMRVVPDDRKIHPGYLYAFISSKFGIPIVVSGTYGSIIQSIEPEHIATLPVPRFGKKLEQQVHDLVQEAADLRSEASSLVASGDVKLREFAGLPFLRRPEVAYPFGISIVSSRMIQRRLDAFFHSPFHSEPLSAIKRTTPHMPVSQLAESIVEPVRFKRIHTEAESHGIPFFGTSAIMNADPAPSYMLVRSNAFVQQCIVGESTVLIPRSGQVSGIIGSAVLPFGDLIGGAVTEDAIRVNCKSEVDAGFVFIALNSEYGRRQLKARSFGSSIPHLDVHNIGAVMVPKLPQSEHQEIGAIGHRSGRLRDLAIKKERAARALVETAIEENA